MKFYLRNIKFISMVTKAIMIYKKRKSLVLILSIVAYDPFSVFYQPCTSFSYFSKTKIRKKLYVILNFLEIFFKNLISFYLVY